MSDITCPHCHAQMTLTQEASIPEQVRFTLSLYTEAGTYMQAETLGKAIIGMADIHAATSKPFGIATATMIERVDTHDDGSIHVAMLLVNRRDPNSSEVP